MKIELVNIEDIIPYKNNAKEHPKEQIEQIVNSIKEFGFNDPIAIDENNVIIEGHGRLEAVKKLKYKQVECIKLSHLTDAQKKAYIIAHNKLTLNSGFDMDTLIGELKDLQLDEFDLTLTGFDSDILSQLLDEPKEVIEDDYDVTPPEEPKSKLGDLWLLGEHRLLCGDSTDESNVIKLVGENKIEMVLTDPPYNINYKGLKDERQIINDKMSDEDFVEFIQKSLIEVDTIYMFCSWQFAHLFKMAMENKNIAPKSMIIWNKVNPAQNLDKYYKQHEIIWYYGKFGGQKTLRGDVWECKRQKNTLHPTMKPLELLGMIINDNPQKKHIYDGFGGSGSTLIASEQLDRKCYMMELDEKYIDVIVNRYASFNAKNGTIKPMKLIRDGIEYDYLDIFGGAE